MLKRELEEALKVAEENVERLDKELGEFDMEVRSLNHTIMKLQSLALSYEKKIDELVSKQWRNRLRKLVKRV